MIETAIIVITADLLAIRIPVVGKTIDNVEHTIVDFDPMNFQDYLKLISVYVNFYISFLKSNYPFQAFSNCNTKHVFPFFFSSLIS